MHEVALDFRLTGDGWSEATFRMGGARLALLAGYLTDALGDLVRAAVAVADGQATPIVIWDAEPNQYRWYLQRSANAVEVRIAGDDQWVDGDLGTTLLRSACTPVAFCSAVADAATEVLSRHGVDGYLDLWGQHPFPLAALEALKAALP